MIEIVEQASDVELDDPIVVPAAAPGNGDCRQCRLSRPITIGVIAEHRIKLWLKPHLHRRLRDPIGYCRHTPSELHSIPTGLWDRLKSSTHFTHCGGSGSPF
jgi:hypothetical protein